MCVRRSDPSGVVSVCWPGENVLRSTCDGTCRNERLRAWMQVICPNLSVSIDHFVYPLSISTGIWVVMANWRKTVLAVDKALTCIKALATPTLSRTIDKFWLPVRRRGDSFAEVLRESCGRHRKCCYC